MKKAFSVSFLIIGTMIGAGYASGQEIIAFFGTNGTILVPVICGVLFFIFSAVLLIIGSKLKAPSLSVVNKALFGKAGSVVDIFILFNSLIVLSAMMAGLDEVLGNMICPFPYGIAVGLFAGLILSKKGGLLSANTVVVPFIILALFVTCVQAELDYSGELTFIAFTNCFTYVSMNLLLSAGILTQIKGLSLKQIFLASGVSALVIMVLMMLIVGAISGNEATTMPLLGVVSNIFTRVIFIASLITAIFTTLLSALSTLRSWADSAFGFGNLGTIGALILAGFLSLLGFEKVVELFYPIVGIIGVVYIIFGIVYIARHSFFNHTLFNKRNHNIHKSSKNTE